MFELTPKQQQFVDAQIASGTFRNASEVVGAALEMLAVREREYGQLREAIRQVERGEIFTLDFDDIKRRGAERKSAE